MKSTFQIELLRTVNSDLVCSQLEDSAMVIWRISLNSNGVLEGFIDELVVGPELWWSLESAVSKYKGEGICQDEAQICARVIEGAIEAYQ